MTPNQIYEARKQFFNDHAGKWLDMWYKNPDTGQHNKHEKDFERLLPLLPLKAGDCVLDVGCGTGVLVPFILERIKDTGILYEVDYAEKMIEINRLQHKFDNVRFIVSEAENVPLADDSCGVVVCFSSFPHFHNKEKALMRLFRVLKLQGVFVIAHFASSEGIKKHHASCHAVMHDHLPGKEDMVSLLQRAGLKVEIFIDEPGFYYILARK
jgi:demethylmenaquinone methyltransferase/2-methoxy-6-polyprenyl-1,4-benzoquinol methylase